MKFIAKKKNLHCPLKHLVDSPVLELLFVLLSVQLLVCLVVLVARIAAKYIHATLITK